MIKTGNYTQISFDLKWHNAQTRMEEVFHKVELGFGLNSGYKSI